MRVWMFELGVGMLLFASLKLALVESFLPKGTSQYGPPAWQCLSLGGRLIFVQVVLSQLMVYWGHLYYLPSRIVALIKTNMARFLWGGTKMVNKFHLCKIDIICCPKELGGWGILNTRIFNIALLMKSFWRAINGNSIWCAIVRCKYIGDDYLQQLICHDIRCPRNISAIWNSFKKVMGFVINHLAWQFCNGQRIPLSYKSIMSVHPQVYLSPRLIHRLSHRGCFFLSQTILYWSYDAPIFKSAVQLGLNGEDADEWERIRDSLRGSGLCLSQQLNQIRWNGPTKKNSIIVKDIYRGLISASKVPQSCCPFNPFWRRRIPTKITVFGWRDLVLKDHGPWTRLHDFLH